VQFTKGDHNGPNMLWVVMKCSVAARYCLKGPCCLHHQPETLSYCNTEQHQKPKDLNMNLHHDENLYLTRVIDVY